MTDPKGDHPPQHVLRQFVAGSLGDGESESIEWHLESCRTCCDAISKLVTSDDGFESNVRTALLLGIAVDVKPTTCGFSLLRDLQRSGDSTAGRPDLESTGGHPAARTKTRVPHMIAHFEVHEQLGAGSFGVVWRGFDTRLLRDVAIKIPRLANFATDELRQRFVREARAAASLSHPNILPVYESGEDGEICYIASEYCSGPDLSLWLSKRGRPDPKDAARIVAALADGLHHAHSRGVFHRDLKPANIMLAPVDKAAELTAFGFVPKIMDFGLAKIQEDEFDVTRSRCVLGTAGYMAPEIANGQSRSAGPATDVYALGAILYELLTLRQPFVAATEFETLQRIQTTAPTPPTRIHSDTPTDLQVVALTCLQKDPSHRYASAKLLQEDLQRYLDGKPISAKRVGPTESAWRWARRNPRRAGIAAAVVTLAALFVASLCVANLRWRTLNRELHQTLWTSYLERSQLSRNSLSLGRRGDSLWCVERARDLMGSLGHGEDELATLRQEAVAAMTLSDLRVERAIDDVVPDDQSPMAWDADLKHYAAPSPSGVIHVRRFEDNQTVARCQPPDGRPVQLAFSPDGRVLSGTFESSRGTHACAWSLGANGMAQAVPLGTCARGAALDFADDSASIVVPGVKEQIRIHDARTGRLKRQFAVEGPTGCRVSPSRSRIAVWDGHAFSLHDLSSGRRQSRFELGNGLQQITTIAWSDDCRALAVGGSDHSIYVMNLESEEPRQCVVLYGHEHWIASAVFVASDRLLSTDLGGQLRVWDLTTATSALVGEGKHVVLARDGGRVAGLIGRSAVRWQFLDDRACRTGVVGYFPYEVYDFTIMSDRDWGVSFDSQMLAFWDLAANWHITYVDVDPVPIEIIFASSQMMLAVCEDGLFHFRVSIEGESEHWAVQEGTQLLAKQLGGHGIQCRMSSEGGILAVAVEGREMLVLRMGQDFSQPRQLARFAVPDLTSFDVSHAGNWIVTASANGVEQWDASTGQRLRCVSEVRHRGGVDIGHNDAWVSIAHDGRLDLWSTADWRAPRRLVDGPLPILDAEFSPNGRYVAVSRKGEGRICLHETETGRLITAFPCERVRHWITFSGDSRYMFHRGKQLSVVSWDIQRIVRRLGELKLLEMR